MVASSGEWRSTVIGDTAMGRLWNEMIVEPGKIPLLLCMVAFVVTFIITRLVVRLIRAGKGPFSDNTVGGVHIHHVVPGLLLMTVGGLVALGGIGRGWDGVGAVLFGIGLALVLDEFALILHLEDVYWESEGRLSVDVVFVIGGLMLLLVIAGSPFGVESSSDRLVVHVGLTLLTIVNFLLAIIAALKGKLATAVIGVFVPVVAYVGAARLARPKSGWARRRYATHPVKQERAVVREERFDARWRSKLDRVKDVVSGTSKVA
jgi:hypothetical protein